MQCGFSFELLLIIPLHIPENSFVKTMQCLVYWTNVQIKLLCERGSGVSIVYELYICILKMWEYIGFCLVIPASVTVEFKDGCFFSATMLHWRAAVLILSFSWLGVVLYYCVRCRDYTSFFSCVYVMPVMDLFTDIFFRNKVLFLFQEAP